jgi:hypothetical protein
MSILSNPKHELTAQELAKGATHREAYKAAGYQASTTNSLDANSSRLISSDKVKSRVQELQMEASKTIAITLEGQIAKLEDLLNQAKQLKQISAGVSAIDKQNELMGLKVQRVESKRVDVFANMSDEELEAYVNGDRGLEH